MRNEKHTAAGIGWMEKLEKSVYQVRKALWSYPTGDGLVYRLLGTARLIKELGVAKGGPPSGGIRSFTTHTHIHIHGHSNRSKQKERREKSGKRKWGEEMKDG